MTVIIGIDPHKASHTAVAIDEHEQRLGELRVAAERGQTQRLLAWAAPFEERAWAVESADGLGKLLSQQLVAEGEHVIDVPPTLAARVRLLGSTKAGKSDPNDALSTAIAGLRHGGLRRVVADDDRVVLRLLVRRFGDVTAARTRAVCRLHAVLIELIPGGLPRKLKADQAAAALRKVRPIVAALIIGYAGDPARFTTRHQFAAYNGTAPIEASSGPKKRHRLNPRGNRKLNHAMHLIAITQIRNLHSPGRAFYDRKLAEGKTNKEALRALKRRVSDAVWRQLQVDLGRR